MLELDCSSLMPSKRPTTPRQPTSPLCTFLSAYRWKWDVAFGCRPILGLAGAVALSNKRGPLFPELSRNKLRSTGLPCASRHVVHHLLCIHHTAHSNGSTISARCRPYAQSAHHATERRATWPQQSPNRNTYAHLDRPTIAS